MSIFVQGPCRQKVILWLIEDRLHLLAKHSACSNRVGFSLSGTPFSYKYSSQSIAADNRLSSLARTAATLLSHLGTVLDKSLAGPDCNQWLSPQRWGMALDWVPLQRYSRKCLSRVRRVLGEIRLAMSTSLIPNQIRSSRPTCPFNHDAGVHSASTRAGP